MPGIRWPWRANWTTPSCTCAPMNPRSASGCAHQGPGAGGAGHGCPDGWCTRPLAGAPNHRADAAYLSRLDVSAHPISPDRTRFLLCRPLLELALACDRSYMLDLSADDAAAGPRLVLGARNFGTHPMANGQSRLQRRFYGDDAVLQGLRAQVAVPEPARRLWRWAGHRGAGRYRLGRRSAHCH